MERIESARDQYVASGGTKSNNKKVNNRVHSKSNIINSTNTETCVLKKIDRSYCGYSIV